MRFVSGGQLEGSKTYIKISSAAGVWPILCA